MDALVIKLLKKHEGFVDHIYYCTAGKKTIGYGYNIEANPLKLSAEKIAGFSQYGITDLAATALLIECVKALEFTLYKKIACWPKLSEVRQAVLLDMAFNLGVEGLLSFKNMLACLNRADYITATEHMLNSQWRSQVKQRAIELANLLLTGKSA